jgi:acetyl-CoA C-acetyltransferase
VTGEPAVDPRMPVLVGAGTSLDDAEAAELMVRATIGALADSGGERSLLTAVDRISVPRGSWSYTDPARIVADRIGVRRALTHLVDLGIPQQTLINEALAAIRAGECDVVVVVGAEARAHAARQAGRRVRADAEHVRAIAGRDQGDQGDQGDRATGSGEAAEIDQGGAQPDRRSTPGGELVSRAEIAAGLVAPVEQYALIESALRAAEGTALDRHRRDIADLWARMNRVAGSNPEAAFGTPMSADDLVERPGRGLAYPYAKWHASQWTVDQGAALVLCSAAAARRHGVPRDRWLFPLVALESSHSVPLPRRRQLHRWPAMAVLGAAAEKRIGAPLGSIEDVEVYSCFPAAVRVQQRELGLPAAGTPTITGGMTFAGGPLNNFVLQATAAMRRRLSAVRLAQPGRPGPVRGLVTTVSGFLTKPGLAVWATEPDGEPTLVADLGSEAAAATEVVDVIDDVGDYSGPGTLAAVTATYDGDEPDAAVAIVDTATGGGRRAIARCHDRAVARLVGEAELVGRPCHLDGGTFTLTG